VVHCTILGCVFNESTYHYRKNNDTITFTLGKGKMLRAGAGKKRESPDINADGFSEFAEHPILIFIVKWLQTGYSS
jgi:hypothetical protein